jgi:hypothetical protein
MRELRQSKSLNLRPPNRRWVVKAPLTRPCRWLPLAAFAFAAAAVGASRACARQIRDRYLLALFDVAEIAGAERLCSALGSCE